MVWGVAWWWVWGFWVLLLVTVLLQPPFQIV
jgi:hypothetical protein